MMKRILIAVLLLCGFAAAQRAYYGYVAQTTYDGFFRPVPGASVNVCGGVWDGHTACPTGGNITVYSDEGAPNNVLSQPLTADANGFVWFWAAPQFAYLTVSGPGVTTYTVQIVIAPSAASPTLSNITVTTATTSGVNLTVKQLASQTGDLLDFQSSSGSGGDLGKVDSNGGLTWLYPAISPNSSAQSVANMFGAVVTGNVGAASIAPTVRGSDTLELANTSASPSGSGLGFFNTQGSPSLSNEDYLTFYAPTTTGSSRAIDKMASIGAHWCGNNNVTNFNSPVAGKDWGCIGIWPVSDDDTHETGLNLYNNSDGVVSATLGENSNMAASYPGAGIFDSALAYEEFNAGSTWSGTYNQNFQLGNSTDTAGIVMGYDSSGLNGFISGYNGNSPANGNLLLGSQATFYAQTYEADSSGDGGFAILGERTGMGTTFLNAARSAHFIVAADNGSNGTVQDIISETTAATTNNTILSFEEKRTGGMSESFRIDSNQASIDSTSGYGQLNLIGDYLVGGTPTDDYAYQAWAGHGSEVCGSSGATAPGSGVWVNNCATPEFENNAIFGQGIDLAGSSSGSATLNAQSSGSPGIAIVLPASSGTLALTSQLPLTGSVSATEPSTLGCNDTTVTITGATTSMVVVVSPTTAPDADVTWSGWVSAANTADVHLCTLASITPAAHTYQVRVIQ